MTLKVILFANYRETAGVKDVELDARTVQELVEELIRRYPGLTALLFQDGELKRYVNILVNGVGFRDLDGLSTQVHDGDEIKIFPPVSGG
jgi:sulfur-carrier protein